MKHKKQRISLTKLWTFCLGSLCLGACSSTSIEDEEAWTEAGKASIAFGADLSRAAVNTGPGGTLAGMKGYAVWGWYGYEPSGAATNNVVSIFDNTTVSYPSGTYEGTRYWEMNKTYRFFAVHPAGLTAAAEGQSQTAVAGKVDYDKEGKLLIENFDTSRMGQDAVDLMTAKSAPITTKEGAVPNPVALTFSHELAKVNIIILGADEEATVTDVQIVGVGYKGNYVTPTIDLHDPWSINERTQESTTPFRLVKSIQMDTETKNVNIFGGDLLLIPQQLTPQSLFVMSWTYRKSGKTRTVTVPFPQAGYDQWERGKSYVYSATIPAYHSDITLDVKVQDWNKKITIDVELN